MPINLDDDRARFLVPDRLHACVETSPEVRVHPRAAVIRPAGMRDGQRRAEHFALDTVDVPHPSPRGLVACLRSHHGRTENVDHNEFEGE